ALSLGCLNCTQMLIPLLTALVIIGKCPRSALSHAHPQVFGRIHAVSTAPDYSKWTDEQIVKYHILQDRDPDTRPSIEGGQVQVLITLILERIVDIDERNQILTTSMRINHVSRGGIPAPGDSRDTLLKLNFRSTLYCAFIITSVFFFPTPLPLGQRWKDDNLRWDYLFRNISRSASVNKLSLPSREVWLPDTYVFNK
ncbi:hypothetical protein Ciccas_012695, partial [Cichlidogyrus casuarinus]